MNTMYAVDGICFIFIYFILFYFFFGGGGISDDSTLPCRMIYKRRVARLLPGKMRLPLLPILLALTITMLISTSCGAQRAFPPNYWKSKLQRPLLGGAADLPSWIKKTINVKYFQ